ncbi:MAG TPA: IclR family transcriptional regulator C-terminal domain-containing protein [Aliidongia sp.]|uniref:IclR family transcriptional regulator domain-containing protein n=1 Tax=Aliidongia sp. TaxID=1914230 RepID=UPI002DDD3042|nr:IclR family transcriptional regulator C-terminal domain-containing protein [Aliidongia sp.]HEV2676960.1 IclR family transcriptional regulator C-terminal domain-containing protein [Aliidongia sp.]
MPQADSDADFVHSLARGLAVIRAFGADAPHLTMSDIAKRTGLSRAAVRRFLHTLIELGYVGLEGRNYSLRPRILELGYAFLSSVPVWSMMQPALQDVSTRLRATCSAGLLDGVEVVYVARAGRAEPVVVSFGVGARLPAFHTAMGRVLLAALSPEERAERLDQADLRAYTPLTLTDPARLMAELDIVADQGWAIVDREFEPGLIALGVPLRNRAGKIVAALVTSARASRLDAATMRTHHLPALIETCERLMPALHLPG